VCPAKDRQNPEIKAINMMSRLGHVEEEESELRVLPQPAGNRPQQTGALISAPRS
jgi:hypothetical protein